MGLSTSCASARGENCSMIFEPLELESVFLIRPETVVDSRGTFLRTYCKQEFKKQNFITDFVQHNISKNKKRGTIRGLHYQTEPFEECKVVRCISGVIMDIIVDIRKSSPTFGHWLSIELSAENECSIYIPRGFAHGFQTLSDNSTLYYLMSEFYSPEHSRGIIWNDPDINVKWPITNSIISERDRGFSKFFS